MYDDTMRQKSILVITQDECSYCILAKRLLTMINRDYVELNVPRDISKEEFKSMFADEPKTVPKIYFDNELIGGYNDLIERIYMK